MITDNLIKIIFAFIIIAVVVYLYYNFTNKDVTVSDSFEAIEPKKKVKFDENVVYNSYSPYASESSMGYASSSKIDVDSICKNSKSRFCRKKDENDIENIDIDFDISAEEERNNDNKCIVSQVCAINQVDDGPEDTWDANFRKPLTTKEEKKNFTKKLQKSYKQFGKAIGDFNKYQMDQNSIIKTDTTIDPFRSEQYSSNLQGKTIQEIYDEQVAGPKAKPKKIKQVLDNLIIYEDEKEINGGLIKGTNLTGFDGQINEYKNVDFGNEF